MPAALPYTTKIAQSSSRKRKYSVRKAAFGNGYSQAAPDGINYIKDVWNVTFEMLTQAERDAFVVTLDSLGSWDYFTWQSFGDSASKRWLVSEDGWSESTTGLYFTITMTLEQTY